MRLPSGGGLAKFSSRSTCSVERRDQAKLPQQVAYDYLSPVPLGDLDPRPSVDFFVQPKL
jgi:hypothetical protein